jgi:hypothetical protein
MIPEAGSGASLWRGGGEAWKWPEDASDNEPNFVLARGLHAVGDL